MRLPRSYLKKRLLGSAGGTGDASAEPHGKWDPRQGDGVRLEEGASVTGPALQSIFEMASRNNGKPDARMRIHPTAIVEEGVVIGAGTSIWDSVHIRKNARVGRDSIIGEKSYIAYDVAIGDLVKINAGVYICAGVTIEDGCMI